MTEPLPTGDALRRHIGQRHGGGWEEDPEPVHRQAHKQGDFMGPRHGHDWGNEADADKQDRAPGGENRVK